LYWSCIETNGHVLGLDELPGRHRRRSEVAHLPGLDQVVQRFHGLLDRHRGVVAVDLVQVDVIGAEPAQALLDLSEDRAPGQPGALRARPHSVEDLRGDDHLVPLGELAQ
jgi:hypothetical protein